MNFNDYQSKFGSANLTSASGLPKTEIFRAIVLAGENGFSSSGGLIPAGLRGQRPSQFCRTPGSEIVINRTRKQIEKLFSPENVMFVVTEEHNRYYKEVLSDVKAENLIVQPQDDGTTLAILYAALRMAIINPSAILTFFPADFHAKNVGEFMHNVQSAGAFVRREPNLILLGLSGNNAKSQDEFIELDPSAPVDKNFGVWRVRRFVSRTTKAHKQELMRNDALVNSSVMVGTPSTFLRKIRRAAPDIYERFSHAAKRIGTESEQRAVRAAYYSQYEYTDFSRDVLEKSAEKLLVVPVPASLKTAVGIEPTTIAKVSQTNVTDFAPKFYTAQIGA